jgi:bleomycin hydrolase
MKRNIDNNFLETCEKKFKEDPLNIATKNAINNIGIEISTTDCNKLNDISHIFEVSLKSKDTKATNQGASGRCWMFASLNTFRHLLIKALGLENFEFSEVYLFFWDKFERSNSYLRWFIKNRHLKASEKPVEYMLTSYMNDGGWWNTFANLAEKYGLIPKDVMKPTFQSEDSGDMNFIIEEKLNSTVNYILKNKKLTDFELEKIRMDTLEDIYSILVKTLGEPPKTFTWCFRDEDDNHITMRDMTPLKFKEMVIPEINLSRDFNVLCNIPKETGLKYGNLYRILETNNVQEGVNCVLYNTDIEELAKHAMKSIDNGVSVWFVGDVSKGFNHYHSVLDDNLQNTEVVFGKNKPFNKGERILLRNVEGNHAMALTGYSLDKKGRVKSWQVENSWGYWDYETPGLDGFLYMSHDWFKKYITQIVVHKELLSRTISKNIKKGIIKDINPWDCVAPALMAKPVNPPKNYQNLHKKRQV